MLLFADFLLRHLYAAPPEGVKRATSTDDTCDPASGCASAAVVWAAPDLCTLSACAEPEGECLDTQVVCPDGLVCDPDTGQCDVAACPCEGLTVGTTTWDSTFQVERCIEGLGGLLAFAPTDPPGASPSLGAFGNEFFFDRCFVFDNATAHGLNSAYPAGSAEDVACRQSILDLVSEDGRTCRN